MDALKGAKEFEGRRELYRSERIKQERKGKAFLGAISIRERAIRARLHLNTVMATGDSACLLGPLFITGAYLPSVLAFLDLLFLLRLHTYITIIVLVLSSLLLVP